MSLNLTNGSPTHGYRWVSVDGPYACRSKDDLREISRHSTDLIELKMVQEGRAYFLIQGQIVQIDRVDAPPECRRCTFQGIPLRFGR